MKQIKNLVLVFIALTSFFYPAQLLASDTYVLLKRYYPPLPRDGGIIANDPVVPERIISTFAEFPKAWIEESWEKGYRILSAKRTDDGWVFIMERGNYRQKYAFDPSFDLVQEITSDGYRITVASFNVATTVDRNLYVFSIKDSHAERQEIRQRWDQCPGIIFEGWIDNKILYEKAVSIAVCSSAAYNRGSRTQRAFLLIASNTDPRVISQKYALRSTFPHDYIRSVKSEGYEPQEIWWSTLKRKWFILVTKIKKDPFVVGSRYQWALVNYTDHRSNFDAHIAAGYVPERIFGESY